MALTQEQFLAVEDLKRLVNASVVGNLTDDDLYAILASVDSDTNLAASRLWGMYAAATATLVDVAEGSSRRQLGDLYEQALKMSAHFAEVSVMASSADAAGSSTSYIRRS